jgi:hypothetical protein
MEIVDMVATRFGDRPVPADLSALVAIPSGEQRPFNPRPRRGRTPPASTSTRRPVRRLVSITSTASVMKPLSAITCQNCCNKSGRTKIEYSATDNTQSVGVAITARTQGSANGTLTITAVMRRRPASTSAILLTRLDLLRATRSSPGFDARSWSSRCTRWLSLTRPTGGMSVPRVQPRLNQDLHPVPARTFWMITADGRGDHPEGFTEPRSPRSARSTLGLLLTGLAASVTYTVLPCTATDVGLDRPSAAVNTVLV